MTEKLKEELVNFFPQAIFSSEKCYKLLKLLQNEWRV